MTSGKDEKSVSEDSSSNTSSTPQTTGRESDNDNTQAIRETLTKRESSAVLRLKIVVILVLLLSGVAVCVVVFLISRNGQMEEFEGQYEGTAEKVIDSYEGILQRIGSISSVGVAATIHGMDRGNASWPFVTLSSFQQRATTARLLSGSIWLGLNPLVIDENRNDWERYVVGEDKNWIAEGIQYQEEVGLNDFELNKPPMEQVTMVNYTRKPIFYYNSRREKVFDSGPGPYLPSWQTSPVLFDKEVNENLLKIDHVAANTRQCLEHEEVIFGSYETAPPGPRGHWNATTDMFATLRSMVEKESVEYHGDPMARVYLPVYNSFDKDRRVVGVMMALVHWRQYFRNILPKTMEGITVILENSCDGQFTYEIKGYEAYVIGFGDHHDTQFDKFMRTGTFSATVKIADGTKHGLRVDTDGCQYELHVYPSQEFVDMYHTKTPILITFAVAVVFLFATFMFFAYDHLVEKRQTIVLSKAVQSTAIVSSLFPKQVRDRILAEGNNNKKNSTFIATSGSRRLKSYLKERSGNDVAPDSQIADLFPHCTVLFADIAGFTAWSSTREPKQVFVLLQSIYQNFDNIAKRRRVFKVETIGDCYLAVTGLPEPQAKHAIIMARFAWDCRRKMRDLVRELEVTLGPDTGDLAMRIGMHSGPVIAGVLRGDRARFQLFGDTVNTAARMESNGAVDRIQISQSMADIIVADGKGHWIKPREDSIDAKGKGALQTYWLNPGKNKKATSTTSSETGLRSDSSHLSANSNSEQATAPRDLVKQERLVDWIVDLLLEYIRKMLVKRNASIVENENNSLNLSEHLLKTISKRSVSGVNNGNTSLVYHQPSGKTCLDEVQDVIHMADFDEKVEKVAESCPDIIVDDALIAAVREYVSIIANMYRENPFHTFEHACHVTMSVNKLLKRIIAPELSEDDLKIVAEKNCLGTFIHNCTYGISGDPLARLAIVFSALIHDVDHRGVSNVQLMKEEPEMGNLYKGKSVAEQNSLDLAWGLLMTDRFMNLRKFVFGNQDELLRFRQFVVNSVLATDIFDKELNSLRNDRWQKAFGSCTSDKVNVDRKATIVIEYIMQASDVSHTMQHWHIFRKWNTQLLKEMCLAHRAGRLRVDPKTFWYKGELAFFDNYIIPLAKKLQDCNVFGVSSDEYLNYAVCNRAEWAQKGDAIVDEVCGGLGLDCAGQ